MTAAPAQVRSRSRAFGEAGGPAQHLTMESVRVVVECPAVIRGAKRVYHRQQPRRRDGRRPDYRIHEIALCVGKVSPNPCNGVR